MEQQHLISKLSCRVDIFGLAKNKRPCSDAFDLFIFFIWSYGKIRADYK